MRKRILFFTVLALGLSLGLLGCAHEVDDPENSDTIIRIESMPSCVEVNDAAAVTVGGIARGGAAATPLNDVILERYQVKWLSVPGGVGPLDITVLVPSDSTGSFTALVGNPGTSTNASIHVEGRDTLGNPAYADAQFHIEVACP